MKTHIDNFTRGVNESAQKIELWKERLPDWIDTAKIFLIVFLVWFGLGQISLCLHGRSLAREEPRPSGSAALQSRAR